jgi:hypothetical protein
LWFHHTQQKAGVFICCQLLKVFEMNQRICDSGGWKKHRGLPNTAQVVQDVTFCGLGCGLENAAPDRQHPARRVRRFVAETPFALPGHFHFAPGFDPRISGVAPEIWSLPLQRSQPRTAAIQVLLSARWVGFKSSPTKSDDFLYSATSLNRI